MGNMVKELQTKLEATWVERLDIKRTSDKARWPRMGVAQNVRGGTGKGSVQGI